MYPYDELYTPRQAAAFLNVSEMQVRAAIKEGRLHAWRMPHRKDLLVRKSDLLPYMDGLQELPGPRQLSLFGEDKAQSGAA